MFQVKKLAVAKSENNFYTGSWSDNKVDQRKLIVDVVSENIESSRIRCLSLPGKLWAFENQLVDLEKPLQVVGFESNRTTFESAIPYMPRYKRRRPKFCNWRTPFGFVDAITSEARKSRFVMFDCCISTVFNGFLRFPTWKSEGTAKGYQEDFNVIWIDATCQLGCKFYSQIMNGIPRVVSQKPSVLAFSYLKGRDDPKASSLFRSFGGRHEYIKAAVTQDDRRIRFDDLFEYSGVGGCRMMTSIFVVV